MEIIELEIGCYQLEAIDLLEAHIMLFTSKLSAGVHQLKASQAMPPKGKPPPQRGKGGKKPPPPKSSGGPPKGKAPPGRKKGQAPKPPESSKPKPKPQAAKAKKPLMKSKPKGGESNPVAPSTTGAVAQAMHAAGASGKTKKKLIKKGKSKRSAGGSGN